MDWLLALLAAFNAVSMITIYRDRHAERVEPPWTLFAYSLITTELAWVWLPVQFLFALTLVSLGALSSALGVVALLVLVLSWLGLVNNISLALQSTRLTEAALQSGLGADYRQDIGDPARHSLEDGATFQDWWRPFHMRRPGVEKLKNIAYGPAGIRQRLDIYRPTRIPDGGCPVLLQIHGGAWMMGSKDRQALPLMYHMASKGWICVAINYRLSPSMSFPVHIEDCKRALCWIRTEGHKYGMNPDFVAVTGGSAGGHLTALMGLTPNLAELQPEFPDIDTGVQAVVPFYGVYDMLARFDTHSRDGFVRFIHNRIIHQPLEQNPEIWDLASPITHIHRQAPPFMIIQGEIDSLTNSRGAHIFHQKLLEVSENPAVYLELPGAEHAFDNIHSPRTDPVIHGVHRFLEWSLAQHSKRGDQVASETGAGHTQSPSTLAQAISG
jgi:acetyl esterase/lipase